MKQITNLKTMQEAFANFPVFKLYLRYAFQNMNPQMFVDDEEYPKTWILLAPPGVFVQGLCDKNLVDSIREIIPQGSWVISPTQEWDDFLAQIYGEHLDSFPRVLFDASTLDINRIRAARKPILEELMIVPIEEQHLRFRMLNQEIISSFFQKQSFLQKGFGLVLIDQSGTVQGYAATNYPIDGSHEIEVSFRVGYHDFEQYRHQGIATTLASFFLEEAIRRGYTPEWDSANEISAHIARKFGYTDLLHWKMHHIIS